MHSNAAGFALIALSASVAFGQKSAQDVDRVFYLTHTETPQERNEIAVVIRSVADIRQVAVVNEQKALAVHGTDEQVRRAEWLVNELNRPAPDPPPAAQLPNSTAHEYRVGTADDVMRVLYLTWARTPQELQDIVTAVRSVADVQRIFIYNHLKAVALRGTAAQIALSEWLVNELNQPPQGQPASAQNRSGIHEYPIAGGSAEVARVFYFAHVETSRELQEIATAVRSTTNMRRLFINNAHKALAARGTTEQMASAEGLIKELDRPR